MTDRERFDDLLRRAAAELFADNPRMSSGSLVPTPNVIAAENLSRFFEAADNRLITPHHGGPFNTLARPKPGGRWSLLSRSPAGGWYNAEYLPRIAAYSEAILHLGYPPHRVPFEPDSSCRHPPYNWTLPCSTTTVA